MVHLNACGVWLVLSPSAHVGSGNHGDMVLIRHGKRHDAYAFILETFMPFSGVPRCGQLSRAKPYLNRLRLKKYPDSLNKAVDLLFGLALGINANVSVNAKSKTKEQVHSLV